MTNGTISASRTWKLVLAIAIAVVLFSGFALWQRPGVLRSGQAQAESAIPGMETLQTVEQALEAIAQRATPAVVSITAEQTVESVGPQEEEEQSAPGRSEDPLRKFFEQLPFGTPGPRTAPRPVASQGSGVMIDPSGIVLTARHVVRGAQRITVILDTGEKLPGKVLGADDATDLAVVKVDGKKPLPFAPLGDADRLKPGAFALAIGSPFGLEHSVSVGHISALERRVPRSDAEGKQYRHLIQTDAAINRGNSGGPLIDIEGKVVGINTMIVTPTSYNTGVGFAVAINSETKRVIETLRQGKGVQRGLLGVYIQDMDPALVGQYGVKEGAFVNEVMPGKPADKAGIREEDIVTRFGDTKIKNSDDLVSAVEATKPGTSVPVIVVRDGKEKTLHVEVSLLQAPEKPKVVASKPGGILQLTAKEITPELVEKYSLNAHSGVVVTAVGPTGEAARIGLREGDALLKINRTEIRTVADYEKAVAELKKGGPAVIRIQRGEHKLTIPVERLGE